ncbi:XRE family transcriptional regulator [Mycobacterium sp. 852013-51886_SCH5428379]|uniref:helix-turn-helix domain-containing protein n=1 Tax=Mycobacterium sp. 852013-51886_SCH5428379 TaxID=1834111 RepID=UPI0007FC42D9|nr:XRE family transcriptional regulator [Mycobacterium sp. 852013-51886_SCH5428379]
MSDLSDAVQAARRRRGSGSVATFSGARLSIARRMARMSRAELAALVDISPTAITQLEREQYRPTTAVAAELALRLGLPREFLMRSVGDQSIPAASAHFRSLRATPAISRDQALAHAELALEVLTAVEDFVDLPPPSLPSLKGYFGEVSQADIERAAAEARQMLGITEGPIPHVVRLLEARGVLVLRYPGDQFDRRVDAFSTTATERPVVLLSSMKDDKARSRFDCAHELGHLLLHPDAEPGSKVIENQAQDFASAFLAPADEVIDDLPRTLNWDMLHAAKRRWGISLRALVYRAHSLGLFSESAYKRANVALSSWGTPEPGPLGPPESPSLLGAAVALLAENGTTKEDLARHAAVSQQQLELVVAAATDNRPSVRPDSTLAVHD